MTNSLFPQEIYEKPRQGILSDPAQTQTKVTAESDSQSERRRQRLTTVLSRLILAMAVGTWFLMAVGSATRVMNAGLSCPDWPLCYGTLVPSEQMDLQVFLEWFHRLLATSMGLCTILLVGTAWWNRRLLPGWLPWATLWTLGLVMVQGILGGLTVIQLLRFDIVTAHLGTGLLFFSSLLIIGLTLLPLSGPEVTTPEVTTPEVPGSDGSVRLRPVAWGAGIAAGLVYLQSILGGLVASRWALHQCFENQQCTVMNSHLIGIVPAALGVIGVLALMVWLRPRSTLLGGIAVGVELLLMTQLALGYATYRFHLQVEPLTVAHQAVGAALLGSLLALSTLAWKSIHGQTYSQKRQPEKLQPEPKVPFLSPEPSADVLI